MNMKRPGGMKKNMLQLHLADEQALYNSYLPFLKQGGLFIPTDKTYKLGEEIFLLISLFKDGDKVPIAGKVAWINPKGAQGRRPPGIGIHFTEADKGVLRSKLEKSLGALIKSDKNTYTM